MYFYIFHEKSFEKFSIRSGAAQTPHRGFTREKNAKSQSDFTIFNTSLKNKYTHAPLNQLKMYANRFDAIWMRKFFFRAHKRTRSTAQKAFAEHAKKSPAKKSQKLERVGLNNSVSPSCRQSAHLNVICVLRPQKVILTSSQYYSRGGGNAPRGSLEPTICEIIRLEYNVHARDIFLYKIKWLLWRY